MRAEQIMTTDVTTVHADTTIEEVARLLTTRRVGSVPVVDDDNRMVGVVNDEDLFTSEMGIPFSAVRVPVLFERWARPERAAEIQTGRQPKMLVVENDEGSKDITRLFLRKFCELEFAESGEEAIKLGGQTNYNIILMDINLGVGMSGIDATRQIRKINGYKNTAIVALTGFAMRGDREEFIKAGCTHYLSKPFSKQSIIKLVKNIYE